MIEYYCKVNEAPLSNPPQEGAGGRGMNTKVRAVKRDDIQELVEWVAKQLCLDDNRKWESAVDTSKRFFGDGDSKEAYRRRAKKILSHPHLMYLVDRDLPFISLEDAAAHDSSEPWCSGNFTDSLQGFAKKAQKDMFQAGYKPVISLAEKLREANHE